MYTGPSVSEFVSDAFDSCEINKDDIRQEMKQLVLDKREPLDSQQGTLAFRWVVPTEAVFV